ncbi:hypothetical protein GCM10027040_18960 [Halomonas shantousis]
MTDQWQRHRDGSPQGNAAWHAAQQWRERVHQTRPSQGMSGLRLIATWLLFGTMLIVGTLFGLFFLLIGWAMLPFLRHRMKKRAEAFRARQAQYAGGSFDEAGRARQGEPSSHPTEVLEGHYTVKFRQ